MAGDEELSRVFHSCRQDDGTWQAREGLDADCPRCNPPGDALKALRNTVAGIEERTGHPVGMECGDRDCPRCNPPGAAPRVRHTHQCAAWADGPCDCQPVPFEDTGGWLTAEERDARAATDTGQYYCVSERNGALFTRGGRPLYATLAEWQAFQTAAPGAAYLPMHGDHIVPLFGSLPFLDEGHVPDVVGRVVQLVGALEKMVTTTAERIGTLDNVVQKVANRPTHERELLRRAAAMIDPDDGLVAVSHEMRLDWLARYREVTS